MTLAANPPVAQAGGGILPADLLAPLVVPREARALLLGASTPAPDAGPAWISAPDDRSVDLIVVAGRDVATLEKLVATLAVAQTDTPIIVVLDERFNSRSGEDAPQPMRRLAATTGLNRERLRSALAARGASSQHWYLHLGAPGRPSTLIDQQAWTAGGDASAMVDLLARRTLGGVAHGDSAQVTVVIGTAKPSALAGLVTGGVAWATEYPDAARAWRRTRRIAQDAGGWWLRPIASESPALSGPLAMTDTSTPILGTESGEDLLTRLLVERGPREDVTRAAVDTWLQAAASLTENGPAAREFDVQALNFGVDANGWHYLEGGLAVRFPFPGEVFLLRAVIWLLVRRVLRHDLPGVSSTATVGDLVDTLLGMGGRTSSALLVDLWTQLEIDLETRLGPSSRPPAAIADELRALLSTSRLDLLVAPGFSQRVSAVRGPADAPAGKAPRAVVAARPIAAAPRGQAIRSMLWRMRSTPPLRRLAWLLPNPLFDGDWYRRQYRDVPRARVTAYWHYRRHGWREGRDPCPLFDTDWYLAANPDVRAAGMNPLDHYFHSGAGESRDPSQQFSTSWYVTRYADVGASGMNPLLHFLRHGQREGRAPLPDA